MSNGIDQNATDDTCPAGENVLDHDPAGEIELSPAGRIGARVTALAGLAVVAVAATSVAAMGPSLSSFV